MSKNIVFEGWLTKSPPIKRIWRTKWRRRWFALRQSGELPGQYFLDYYADRNCRRLKGTINLDLCEQVDAGLHMERNTHSTLDPKLRGSVFTIQTQSRTYHLEADSESDMERWVDAICRVCGLRATEESPNVLVTYQNNVSAISVANEQYDSTGPYIPISECITGVRAQDSRRAFTFDPKNIVISTRTPFERDARAHPIYMSQPHIRPHNNNAEFSENDSNLSEDESKSLNASQPNIRDWSVAKSFTKSTTSPNSNGSSEDGPPVPPRPPKTFAMSRDMSQRESFQAPKFLEPVETDRECESPGRTFPWIRTARRMSGTAPQSPRRYTHAVARHDDDDEGYALDHVSMQYCNLSIIPPTVDRNLKPRHSSHCMHFMSGHMHDDRSDVLQYLDLDLHTSKPIPSKRQQIPGKVIDINHSKSLSAADTDSAYKTVDFLKTEAFNITRQDAEASRNTQQ